ncbi:MAG TPA: c-type cytochrome biogenesis protein CcsB, partial [Thermopolyspora sp.]
MGNQVNSGLATLSDQLVLATVLLYLAAMIGYALELAFGRTHATAGVATQVAERELVTAGGGAAGVPGP